MDNNCSVPYLILTEEVKIFQRESLAKAYRTLYNYLKGNKATEEKLNLCLIHPKYVAVSSLPELLPKIYEKLQNSPDPWIIHFLQIFSAQALFAPDDMLACPNIASKLQYMYNH